MRQLNLDHLHTLAEVVALGSFSAAARRLNLSQPAVSLQIRQLERRFGLRLVERVGRRVEPTPAGRDLLPYIGRIEETVMAAVEAMRSQTAEIAGRVRLGTGATACIHLLPPMLRGLRRRFPRLEIVVSTGNTPVILAALEANALDVGLVTLPAPGRMFAVTPILEDEIVAVFPGDAPLVVTAAALAELPVLLYEPGGTSRRVIDDWFRAAGVPPKPVMELGNIEAIKELIGAGLGSGLLPLPMLALRDRPDGSSVRSLTPVLRRRLGLVMRRDKVPGRGLRAVVRALGGLRHAGAESAETGSALL